MEQEDQEKEERVQLLLHEARTRHEVLEKKQHEKRCLEWSISGRRDGVIRAV